MKRKTGITISTILVMILCFSMGVAGANTLQNITAQVNYALSMKLNNELFNPKDTDGSYLRPIVYNNRTYLPVRALGEALNIAVDYDAATSTVLLGMKDATPVTSTHLIGDVYYSYTTNPDMLSVGGKLVTYGLVTKKSYSNELTLNAAGKYQYFETSIYAERNCTMIFKNSGTGEIYAKVELLALEWTPISVEIKGAKNLKLELSDEKGQKIVIAEPIFK